MSETPETAAPGVPHPDSHLSVARPVRASRLPHPDDEDDYRPRRPRLPARTEGVLPRSTVRLACFVVLTLCLVGAGAVCILSVWDAAPENSAWKAVATLAIIAAMTAGFTILNEVFGQRAEG